MRAWIVEVTDCQVFLVKWNPELYSIYGYLINTNEKRNKLQHGLKANHNYDTAYCSSVKYYQDFSEIIVQIVCIMFVMHLPPSL